MLGYDILFTLRLSQPLNCLSLRQPYAELVPAGRKTIEETRTWKTNFRGKFLIHASKAID
jgi:ASCH domain-containing protein